MALLPEQKYDDGIKKHSQLEFGGYNHRISAKDGALWDMENLTGDLLPVLAPRKPRYKMKSLGDPKALHSGDGFFWVDGGCLYELEQGLIYDRLEQGEKTLVSLGDWLLVFPDRLYFRQAERLPSGEKYWESGSLYREFNTELSPQLQAVFYKEDPRSDEFIEYGVMELPYSNHGFKAGDALTIKVFTELQTYSHKNIEAIVREVDGRFLVFYENSFQELFTQGLQDRLSLTTSVERIVPEMDFVCECGNRLWGCKGSRIYASKLGDPFNWSCYDGVSTDSWTADVGSPGDFTACCSFQGGPVFFKEEGIYRVFGSRPSTFRLAKTSCIGVAEHSSKSLATAGDRLLFLSRHGVMCYGGDLPEKLSAALGDKIYKNGVAGSNGLKYYISMEDEQGQCSMFVYDTVSGLWHREDESSARDFALLNGELYFTDSSGSLWLTGLNGSVPDSRFDRILEEPLTSMAEFGDFYEGGPNMAGTAKLQLRIEVEAGARVEIALRFDSEEDWKTAAELMPSAKRSYYLPIIPRRCDHFRIRLRAQGGWRLYSLTRECYQGSELKGGSL